MRTLRWCSLAIAFHSATLLAADARLIFDRVIPPPVNLAPAQRLAVIYAIGDNEAVNTFVDRFVEYVGKRGTLQIENAVEDYRHPGPINARTLRKLRREHPADLYVSVSQFTCSGTPQSAEGSERDISGERVQRRHSWIDAVCDARLDIRRADWRPFISLSTRGEGTSPRASSLTSEERDVAYQQAARYAALKAAEMITPRIVRESIDLDDSAPQFAEGMAMISSERLPDARAIWETALRIHRDSAALQYDLGAVCEATGDFNAARRYLESALRLSPQNRLYREELESFKRRESHK